MKCLNDPEGQALGLSWCSLSPYSLLYQEQKLDWQDPSWIGCGWKWGIESGPCLHISMISKGTYKLCTQCTLQ